MKEQQLTLQNPEFKRKYDALPLSAQIVIRLERMAQMPQYRQTRRESFLNTARNFESDHMRPQERGQLEEFRRWETTVLYCIS